MTRLRSGPSPSSNLCAIPASFKFYLIDSFRAVFHRICRGSVVAMTDLEYDWEDVYTTA